MLFLGTSVNKGKNKGRGMSIPASPFVATVLYVGLASSVCSWEASMTPSCCIMPKAS
jgi:hypothetical protein